MQHYSINNVHEGRFAVYEHATKAIPYEGKTREDCQQWIDSCVMYLRKEKHDDGRSTVAYYRDPEATKWRVNNSWPSRPTRRNKWVMLNCVRYRACWLPDLPENA